MNTMLLWAWKTDNEDVRPPDWDEKWGELEDLPSFECHRLEKGDELEILIWLDDGEREQHIMVEIVKVLVTLDAALYIQEIEPIQTLYVKWKEKG